MTPLRQHVRHTPVVLAAVAALAVAAMITTATVSRGATPQKTTLTQTFARIEHKSTYRQSTWGYDVLDQRTGQVLASQNDQQMFDPGSTMKLYSVATGLRLYGTHYRFRTPVYREGTVADGTLSGNLVLVGSGDLTFGLRELPGGRLAYENLPAVDHSYADQLPGAVEPHGNPWLAMRQLAQRVRASGITQINGNVVIDDRLFRPYAFPDGVVSPIWFNENLVDLLVKPGRVGARATIDPRPVTPSYTVTDRVATVSHGRATTLNVTEPHPGQLVVTGQIAAGGGPALRVWEVDHPSQFARTAFIVALRRAGVTVSAPTTGANPTGLLPARGSYERADLVAEHVSDEMSQYAKLILKVSYNRGADLMLCLAAAKLGSRNCLTGLKAEVRTATSLGVPRSGLFPQDGAGSDDQGRSSPQALAILLRGLTRASYGPTLKRSLPILGRDGTMANVLPNSPAAGHAQIKTGNRVVGNAAGQTMVLGNSLAGYIQTRSGRRVTVMIVVGNVPLSNPEGFLGVVNDQAKMIAAIQADL
ncbi:MAG: D-alanyl-D-alanine carboxypeptidase/D-alanyl-D-alanine-endopeptidase [Solirubrobacteraceae bacterium]